MATPTDIQVLDVRGDLETFIAGTAKNLGDYKDRALAQLKRDLDDRKNIEWSQIYVGTAYLSTRNQDKCHNLIALLTVAYVMQDYAIRASGDGQWWELYIAYRADYDNSLKNSRLDVDADGSGAIDDDEERVSPQPFFCK